MSGTCVSNLPSEAMLRITAGSNLLSGALPTRSSKESLNCCLLQAAAAGSASNRRRLAQHAPTVPP